eukprot:TRINITY_DN290_c2_g2_i1.p1 TRINITY_DN290_c2_g2~~TRINITY_DN290_c2_g2_i1.p1  ORF type:complete len:452 (-),score=133.26 TRINITY_DN290_c2_g2_i1:93-1448(-)
MLPLKSAFFLVALVFLVVFISSMETKKIGDGTLSIQIKTFLSKIPSKVVAIKFSKRGDSPQVMYVVTQGGIIYSYDMTNPSSPQEKVFLDISSKTAVPTSLYDERGLMGFTLHTNFATNGIFYVWYNGVEYNEVSCGCDRDVVGTILNLEAYKINQDEEGAVAESLGYLLRVSKPFSDHNGLNNLHMESRNKRLYLLTGDGGCADDPFKAAQDPDQVFGKVLRINAKSTWNCSQVLGTGKLSDLENICPKGFSRTKIVGLGLRNPAGVAAVKINAKKYITFVDVGEHAEEEVNLIKVPRGIKSVNNPANFGWSVKEGYTCTDQSTPACPSIVPDYTVPQCPRIPNMHDPIAVGSHEDTRLGPVYSFIGGRIYKSTQFSCLSNTYIFGEYGGHLYSTSLKPKNDSYINVLRPTTSGGMITAVGISPADKRIFFAGFSGDSNTISEVTAVSCP